MTFHYAPHTYTQHTLALIHALPAYNKNDHFTIRPFIIVVSSRCRCRWYVLRIVLSNPYSISIPFQSNPYHILLYIDGLQIHTTFAFIQHSISNVQWFLFIYRSERNKKNVQKLKEKKKIFQQTGKWRAFVWLDAHCTLHIYFSTHGHTAWRLSRINIPLCIFIKLHFLAIAMEQHRNRYALAFQ